jgi:hypothetical protein
MCLEAVPDEHSLLRISERMGIDQVRVLKLLRLGLYAEVATFTGVYTRKYVVIWDGKKDKPFLLILKLKDGVWVLVTVYETFAGHSRKDRVVVRYHHILEAKRQLDGFAQAIKLKEKIIAQKNIKVQLLVVFKLDGLTMVRRCGLGRVPIEDYEKRFKNDHRLLLRELLEHGKKVTLEVPTDATVYYEFLSFNGKKRETLVSNLLC